MPERNGADLDAPPEPLAAFLEVLRRLRAKDGCAWDAAQTPESLRPYVIEEAFELVEAIDGGDRAHLREELGDVAMQVFLLAVIAEERGWFAPEDVLLGIRDKLVRRHPHVFADAPREGPGAPNWEAIKAEEKAGRGLLQGIPVALPALTRATRVGEKAARVGYDWPDAAAVRRKVDEELAELDGASELADQEAELGDVLFALASWARHRGIDPEAALRGTLARFGERLSRAEAEAAGEGRSLLELDDAERDALWTRVKGARR